MGAIVEAIVEQIRLAGFVPSELRPSTDDERSLFTAVRLAHGMRTDDADVCYWNWRSLRAQLLTVWGVLDAEASARQGRPIQAHVWTFSRQRTEAEVLDLLGACDHLLADLPLIAAVRRPDAAGMISPDKPRGALSSTLGVLHIARGVPMAQVITDVLDGCQMTATNEVLLDHLDAIASQRCCIPGRSDRSAIPKLLCRYFGDALDERGWTYTQYLAHVMEHNWAGSSDHKLADWLTSKSPDPAPRPRRPRLPAASAGGLVAPAKPFVFHPIGAGRSFAAIDVETANSDRASICAIGVAVVHEGAVVKRWRTLCRPPDGFGDFSPFNIGIHGIRPRDVTTSPSFAEAIADAGRLVDGLPVVAHNAVFDVGAIHRACLASGAPVPTFHYGCTMALTRASMPFPTYGLAWCADHFGIPLNHHDAQSDAEASALLALALLDAQQLGGLDELMEKCQIGWGLLTDTEWMRSVFGGPRYSGGSSATAKPPEANPNADPSHQLFGHYVALTGDLVVMTRAQAFAMLAELGAQGQANVTYATQMLVVGNLNPSVLRRGSDITGKMRKAFDLEARGQEIEVIGGRDFLAMLQ